MDWCFIDGQRMVSAGHGSGSTYGTTVSTPLAGADTKGLWSQLASATENTTSGVWLYIGDLATAGGTTGIQSGHVDIGVDPAGGTSYAVAIPDVYCASPASVDRGTPFWTFWPITIGAGSSVAARWQCNLAQKTVQVAIQTCAFGWAAPFRFQTVSAYGTNPTGSTATTIDPGSTPDTKGSWVEIASSTTLPARYVQIVCHMENATAQSAGFKLDMSVGGSGSETLVFQNIIMRSNSATDQIRPVPPGIFFQIPAGTRIALRAASAETDASDRLFNAAVYLVG